MARESFPFDLLMTTAESLLILGDENPSAGPERSTLAPLAARLSMEERPREEETEPYAEDDVLAWCVRPTGKRASGEVGLLVGPGRRVNLRVSPPPSLRASREPTKEDEGGILTGSAKG